MNVIISGMLNNLVFLTETATDLQDKARVLGFDTQFLIQLAIHSITTLALFAILGKLLYKPVFNILQKRKDTIATEFENIKDQKSRANSLIMEYEAKMADVHKETESILAEARKAALDQKNKIVDEAKAEAERIQSRALLEIEREKEKVRDEIKKEIVEVATIMASKFVAQSMDDKTRNLLFEQAINEIGEQTWLS